MRSPDYEEFLESLNAHGVRYLIVGAHAVAFHGHPRATRDLDVFIEATDDNAERTLSAIREFFGGSDAGLTVGDLSDPDKIIQLGIAPSRIDIMKLLSSELPFEEAWKNRAAGAFSNVATQYLSLEDLIREKERAGREQDRADAAKLRKAVLKRS